MFGNTDQKQYFPDSLQRVVKGNIYYILKNNPKMNIITPFLNMNFLELI